MRRLWFWIKFIATANTSIQRVVFIKSRRMKWEERKNDRRKSGTISIRDRECSEYQGKWNG